jgi:glutamyl-tRNA reductase
VLLPAITQNFAFSAPGYRMSLVVVGINHRTAPVEVRERVVFEPARMPEALRELTSLPEVRESVIVSTCNRTELYCVTDSADAALGDWLQRYHQLGTSIHHCLYHHDDMRAVNHAFAVASGLDSMVLGEPQILGQLKDAYRTAQDAGTTGPVLNRLFQAAFSVAKRVRTETEIGANAVSVASAAVMVRIVESSALNEPC